LARALPHLNKENFDVKLLHNPYRLEITTKLENQQITITEAVAASFGLTINEYDLVANETLTIPITPLHGLGPLVSHVKECYLKRNIYKDINHLIYDLNEAFMELVEMIMHAQRRSVFILPPKVRLVDNNHVEYVTSGNYKVTLQPTMLQILHLNDTVYDQTATAPLVLSMPSCEYFFVNIDLIDSHFVNNEHSQLLRVIDNNVMNNHKSMQSF